MKNNKKILIAVLTLFVLIVIEAGYGAGNLTVTFLHDGKAMAGATGNVILGPKKGVVTLDEKGRYAMGWSILKNRPKKQFTLTLMEAGEAAGDNGQSFAPYISITKYPGVGQIVVDFSADGKTNTITHVLRIAGINIPTGEQK